MEEEEEEEEEEKEEEEEEDMEEEEDKGRWRVCTGTWVQYEQTVRPCPNPGALATRSSVCSASSKNSCTQGPVRIRLK